MGARMNSGVCMPESPRTSTVPGSRSGELVNYSPAIHGEGTTGTDEKLIRVEVEEKLVNSYQDLIQCAIAKLLYRLLLYTLDRSRHGKITLELPSGEMWQIIREHRTELNRHIVATMRRIQGLELALNPYHLVCREDPLLSQSCLFHTQGATTVWSTESLNTRVAEIFKDGFHFQKTLTKVCLVLLSSSEPPSTGTYNLIIDRLCHFQAYSMIPFVVRCMNESKIGANETTVATLLRCYTLAGNKAAFEYYVNRMNARNHRGLTLSISPTADVSSRRYCGNRVQKAPKDQDVYDALIMGLFTFNETAAARVEIRNMIREGYKPHIKFNMAILQNAVRVRSWDTGATAWKLIRNSSPGPCQSSYYWMLQLCALCCEREMFDDVLADGVARDILTPKLQWVDFHPSKMSLNLLSRRLAALRTLEIYIKAFNADLSEEYESRLSGAQPAEKASFSPNLVDFVARQTQSVSSLLEFSGSKQEQSSRTRESHEQAKEELLPASTDSTFSFKSHLDRVPVQEYAHVDDPEQKDFEATDTATIPCW